MIKIISIKVFLILCSILLSINVIELIPHGIFTLDFFVQSSLLILTLDAYFKIHAYKIDDHEPTIIKMNYFPLSSMSKLGLGTFVFSYFIKLFLI